MEQTNRIEIAGNIGTVRDEITTPGAPLRFSLANNYAYMNKAGEAKIETVWVNVVVFPRAGREMSFSKGQAVRVTGRLKMTKYTGNDSIERTAYEVIANKVEPLEDCD